MNRPCLDVPYVVSYADGLGVENGGGYRGNTSGGYDHLGFGTHTFR